MSKDKKEELENHGEIVKFNVGGRLFVTTVDTISLLEPQNTLLDIWQDHKKHGNGKIVDGGLFLDRDPDAFALLLRYLRTGIIPDPFDDVMLDACKFYGFTTLLAKLELSPETMYGEVHNKKRKRDSLMTVNFEEIIGSKNDKMTLIIKDSGYDQHNLKSMSSLTSTSSLLTMPILLVNIEKFNGIVTKAKLENKISYDRHNSDDILLYSDDKYKAFTFESNSWFDTLKRITASLD